jgi:hypothetical protein
MNYAGAEGSPVVAQPTAALGARLVKGGQPHRGVFRRMTSVLAAGLQLGTPGPRVAAAAEDNWCGPGLKGVWDEANAR